MMRPHRNSQHLSIWIVRLEVGGKCSSQTEDDARKIGKNERPFALLPKKSIPHPHRTVDERDERLNPVSRMPGQIPHDLRYIRNVHTDGQTGSNRADDAHLILCSLFSEMYGFLLKMLYFIFRFFSKSPMWYVPFQNTIE